MVVILPCGRHRRTQPFGDAEAAVDFAGDRSDQGGEMTQSLTAAASDTAVESSNHDLIVGRDLEATWLAVWCLVGRMAV